MKNFKLSIVIPTWNRKKRLVKLIKLLTSSLKKSKIIYEVIVCDSFSNDGTEELVRKKFYKKNIIYKNTIVNNISTKRNLGIKTAKYFNILLIDDDCVPIKDFFNIIKNYLNSSYPKTIFCGQYFTSKKLIKESNYYRFRDMKNLKTNKRLKIDYKNIITGCCFFNKKEINNTYFNEKIKGYGLEDIDWAYRLKKNNVNIILTEAKVDHQETSKNIGSYLKKWYMLSKDAMPSLMKNSNHNIKGKMFSFENLYKILFLKLILNLTFFIFVRPIAIFLSKYLMITDKYQFLFCRLFYEVSLILYYFIGASDRGTHSQDNKEWYNLGYK